ASSRGVIYTVDTMSQTVARRTARLFRNGRSQAVRLPKEFRFEGTEVVVRREGDAVILEPVSKRRWPRGYWERMPSLDSSFELPADPVPAPIRAGAVASGRRRRRGPS